MMHSVLQCHLVAVWIWDAKRSLFNSLTLRPVKTTLPSSDPSALITGAMNYTI
uniref:Uncharacterized protein n=1 Tax=Anguilla anguilla TaxID=7936 RepID=A0A0E9T1T3_ANGAN